ncbi:DUF2945 domain-containing protein [Marinobacter nanhaiticus D15-8W]|uniref:DUF2945 domain-containing protein n=1 Tax=Marinobacter nanhaiticus D15-8W TaxID=626887 RepID=N6WTW6_9GAMM|nr:DUF2945 domain-containing protein [Marinobacter nanhaiticus]ENO14966.1 DUF2945 domain-containing protein [Marinobacter nanhaiticus D15-8W]BES69338.1 DUF2945 domain-containing protein [Marinobacter nanhaiticus D15-8W]
MSQAYQTNTKVEWDWGEGTANGYVRKVFRETTTQTIKGSEITRHGSDDNPAYLIEQQDGDQVLKLHTEVRKATN